MPLSYLNIHKLCQILKLQSIPRMEEILKLIIDNGFRASRTHFDFTSIKTDIDLEFLNKIILNKFK